MTFSYVIFSGLMELFYTCRLYDFIDTAILKYSSEKDFHLYIWK
jgi:hypothetical protein